MPNQSPYTFSSRNAPYTTLEDEAFSPSAYSCLNAVAIAPRSTAPIHTTTTNDANRPRFDSLTGRSPCFSPRGLHTLSGMRFIRTKRTPVWGTNYLELLINRVRYMFLCTNNYSAILKVFNTFQLDASRQRQKY